MKRYSRLAVTEERKNIKRAYLYIFLSIIALIFLVFLGIPTLVKFAGFVGDIAKSDKPVDINDITPPAPPQFDQILEYTNKDSIEITGKSENSATIKIRANNEVSEIVANNEGSFSFIFNLKEGENSIDAKAVDLSGNESTQTLTYKVHFDNTSPKIEIESPNDGASFYGNGQKQLSIKGTVDEVADITINNRLVVQQDDNSFSFATTLSEGENKFEVKAIDLSGNETTSSFIVNFSL